MTSLEQATGRQIPLAEAEDALIRRFCDVFERVRVPDAQSARDMATSATPSPDVAVTSSRTPR